VCAEEIRFCKQEEQEEATDRAAQIVRARKPNIL
jgi:hypothetical protein